MKYSKRFIEDWNFYYKNRHKFTFCGSVVVKQECDPKGCSAKKAFYLFDSRGKIVSCCEPILLFEIIRCKKSVNWQIKSWAEGYNDCMDPYSFYMNEFIDPPDWVEVALKEQVDKVFRKLLQHPEKCTGMIGMTRRVNGYK